MKFIAGFLALTLLYSFSAYSAPKKKVKQLRKKTHQSTTLEKVKKGKKSKLNKSRNDFSLDD